MRMGCINNDGSRLEDTCFYSNRNSLLDKNGEEGSLASKLKATFMAISKKLYMAKGVNWNGLNMTEPQIPNKDDVRKGDYSIKILCKKDNKGKCTPIKTIYITLR